jgi:diguanylate cyclase (GGDEF)-like protein
MALSQGFSTAPTTTLPEEIKKRGAQRPTLLIVDDEPLITESLKGLFRRTYQVLTASSADQALEILRETDVEVIISDQCMPQKTGAEFLAEARLINADAVRVLLTGHADILAVIQAVNEGKIFFYLTKPWHSKELEAVIGKAMEHSLLMRDKRRLIEELRQMNVELEARVRERTQQLEERASELEKANQLISQMAFVDTLTGVANRRKLDETLAREVDRGARLNEPLTVILADIDHFKAVNDNFGHSMGDKVLQSIAQTLVAQVRQYDLVARYGGEEFLILMPGVQLNDGKAVAERFRRAISGMMIEGFPHQVTSSFGVATLLPGQPANRLFERVDQALYRAKEQGRNCVEVDPHEFEMEVPS